MENFAWWLIESTIAGIVAFVILGTVTLLAVGAIAMARELWADRHTTYDLPVPASHVRVVECRPDDTIQDIVNRSLREAQEIADLERAWSQSDHPSRGDAA